MKATDVRTATSRDALAELYRQYWYPLYAYARRRGFDADAASDLIQAFFAELIEGPFFSSANRTKGRFRSYLLGALNHFISTEWDRARTKKRGGGVRALSLDDAEARYGREPGHELTPERLFERRWAMMTLARVIEQLEQEFAAAGKQQQFEQMKNLIAGPLPDQSYADIGAKLQMSEGAVKVAVHRLRQRYREILTQQIADTVETPEQVEDEIQHLREALAGGK